MGPSADGVGDHLAQKLGALLAIRAAGGKARQEGGDLRAGHEVTGLDEGPQGVVEGAVAVLAGGEAQGVPQGEREPQHLLAGVGGTHAKPDQSGVELVLPEEGVLRGRAAVPRDVQGQFGRSLPDGGVGAGHFQASLGIGPG